jgi:hypothetical protein
MKAATLEKLREFESEIRLLRKNVNALTTERVSKRGIQDRANALATRCVEELRSPLEHKFKIDDQVIQETSSCMKRLQVLARPNNRKASYLEVLDLILLRFKDKFILPIQQTGTAVESVFDLQRLVDGLTNADESDYLKEAIECANATHKRAAIVLGWCAAIDRIQKCVIGVGLNKFSTVSTQLKNQTTGRFKWFNKEFKVTTLNELQQVFDTDLITVCEGMGLLDSNQADRLIRVDFQYRNHSAHPGEAPIEDAHLVAFFVDVTGIVLNNPRFALN